MSEVIYQQDITETECAECGEKKPLKYVNPNDLEMTACSSCYQDFVPREKSKYVKIEDLPKRRLRLLTSLRLMMAKMKTTKTFSLTQTTIR
jgi:hypothetical protein